MAQVQQAITLGSSAKTELRMQFAALCFKVEKKRLEFLLVTGRGSGRWMLPKGWPIDGLTPAQIASKEAFEEAGVEGTPLEICIGHYHYRKDIGSKRIRPCIAAVYPVHVMGLSKKFPEHGERRRMWFKRKKAADTVEDLALKKIIGNFDPFALAKLRLI